MINYSYYPLATRVITVAVINEEVKDWTAYIDAVPGHNHSREYMRVAEEGDKLPEHIAKAIFPQIAEQYTWRS